jgi:hypothetical protein
MIIRSDTDIRILLFFSMSLLLSIIGARPTQIKFGSNAIKRELTFIDHTVRRGFKKQRGVAWWLGLLLLVVMG